MGKIAVASTVGATGATVSLGGCYVFGAFGSSNLDIPVSLSEFPKTGGSIIKDYFPGVSLDAQGANWSTNNPATNFLGTVDSNSNARGRLVVNWEKLDCKTASSSKLTGRIRWLWTFVNGDKGLLLYASAKASSEDSKLDAEGVIYSLSKNKDKWEIQQNQTSPSSPSTTNQVGTSDLSSKFPVVSDTFKNDLKVKDYWGFVVGTDLSQLCKWETEHDNSKEFKHEFKGSWTWKSGTASGGKKPFDWSKTSHTWLTTFYGGTQTPALETLVNGFSGTWTEEYFVNKDLGVNLAQSQK